MSCATLSRKLMDRVHCRTEGLAVSGTFFETLACVAALESEMENGMQSTKAMHARSSMCFYFTANESPLTGLALFAFRTRLRAGRLLRRLLLLAQQPGHCPNQLRDFIIA